MDAAARTILAQEARAVEARLDGLKPFGLLEQTVPAAALEPAALLGIEKSIWRGRSEIRQRIEQFVEWLEDATGRDVPASEGQRRFALMRMRFNAFLSDYEIFSAALTQRSERDNGVWLAGLEVAATDALTLEGRWYASPPLICYLDRGFGAAIRRARTRLPGGRRNPVAVVRIPRERMVGSGIASSLVHEIGHQGAALLDLVASVRPLLVQRRDKGGAEEGAWHLWERWISEIVADLWSVARIGITSTLGLMGVLSLPRAFVFRISVADPHPAPWIRVKLSCALGQALYPHEQWAHLSETWEEFYPPGGESASRRYVLDTLRATMPAFASLLVEHRPRALGGVSLGEALTLPELRPRELARIYAGGAVNRELLDPLRPVTALAAAGQARLQGTISPERESRVITELLEHWAFHRSLTSAQRATVAAPAVATGLANSRRSG
jgi:hypothetical protein